MTPEERKVVESELRTLCDNQSYGDATTLAIRKYGPELLGYLVAVARSEDIAGEVFAVFSEDLWKGLPSFRWQASFRTWAYTLARNALYRFLRDPARKRERIALSQAPEVNELVEKVRTTTLVYLRTEVKDSVAQLREKLDADEQTLLILRVDRRMAWKEIARVMSESSDPDDATIKRESAALRKRFERIKNSLREMAREAGITG
jgi:RNA polymerase sigma-70 factor (ECF subfamily)